MAPNEEFASPDRSMIDMTTAVALGYLDMGYRPIPLIRNTKRSAVKWAEYRARPPTEREIRSWFGTVCRDIALVTGNGVCVVDVDDRTMVATVMERCGYTPMRCRTPGGMHLYYSTPRDGLPTRVRVNGMAVDIRSDGAYAVCPWSRNAAGRSYEWVDGIVPAADLPRMNAAWLRAQTSKKIVSPDLSPCDPITAVRRARGYLSHIEGAISGQRGHDRTFRVACVLAVKFRLNMQDAWQLLNEWNEQCEPPWSEKELLHKLQDAFRLCVS